jgi:hypothetical protein
MGALIGRHRGDVSPATRCGRTDVRSLANVGVRIRRLVTWADGALIASCKRTTVASPKRHGISGILGKFVALPHA